jgi:hypothetical protein
MKLINRVYVSVNRDENNQILRIPTIIEYNEYTKILVNDEELSYYRSYIQNSLNDAYGERIFDIKRLDATKWDVYMEYTEYKLWKSVNNVLSLETIDNGI